jgi:pimeloyl-ACP methyl ester carboxylesterase
MTTKLLEFSSGSELPLRGILASNETSEPNRVVLMLGGFERAATTERKFKKMADGLAAKGISSFRYDTADCGLSDGNFYETTIERLADELSNAVFFLRQQGYERFTVAGHSLAGCAIAAAEEKIGFEKIVLLAPALDQAQLLRLWFVQKNFPDVKVGWNNFKDYLDEDAFLAEIKKDMTAKSHVVNFRYRWESQDKDFSQAYGKISPEKILLVHGDSDLTVPLESLDARFHNRFIVKGGDHDLEKPAMLEQWLENAVDFLTS